MRQRRDLPRLPDKLAQASGIETTTRADRRSMLRTCVCGANCAQIQLNLAGFVGGPFIERGLRTTMPKLGADHNAFVVGLTLDGKELQASPP